MLCVRAPPMFAYYSGAFDNGGQPSSWMLRETAINRSTVMPFVCFVRAAEFGVPDLFPPNMFCALRDESRLCTEEKCSYFTGTQNEGEHNRSRSINAD